MDEGSAGRRRDGSRWPRPRHAELLARRERRREELQQQQALSLQGVERDDQRAGAPPSRARRRRGKAAPARSGNRSDGDAGRHGPRARSQRHVEDVSAKNLGYDVTSLDTTSGDLRLIEVKGLAAATGTILLTPNERRVAEDRPDCYWLYVVTNCGETPVLHDPSREPGPVPVARGDEGAALLSEGRRHDPADAAAGRPAGVRSGKIDVQES